MMIGMKIISTMTSKPQNKECAICSISFDCVFGFTFSIVTILFVINMSKRIAPASNTISMLNPRFNWRSLRGVESRCV